MNEIVKVELITKIKYKGEEHNLQELFNYLIEQLEQKENIIKEVREYIHWRLDNRQDMYITQMTELLEILDKEGEDNENRHRHSIN